MCIYIRLSGTSLTSAAASPTSRRASRIPLILMLLLLLLSLSLLLLLLSLLKLRTTQRRLAWPPRKDDTHKSRSVSNCKV